MRPKLHFPAVVVLIAICASLACTAPTGPLGTPTLTPLAIVITNTTTVVTAGPTVARTVTVRAPIDPPTLTPSATVLAGSPQASTTPCVNESDFVSDVTIPDNTPIRRGETFTKTWRIKNSGTCAWDSQYKFVMINTDDGLAAIDAETNMLPVAPGQTVDLEVSLRVESDAVVGERLRATFQLRAPNGTLFGSTPYVQITVAAAEGSSASASISGLLWADFCSVATNTGNCVDTSTGGKRADGTRQNSEEGIEGVMVELHQSSCTGSVIQQSPTGADGTFTFARLNAGVFCVVINATRDGNDDILIPGEWTFPAERTGTQIVTITAGEIKTGINFGWDSQFD